ncbi:hypothetical protein [uncultured Microscilla sp.]|uniref:hypothetical protein n=1 Tax=uncultured Microscilla sp. TaxID=432653 RepID=UPI0026326D0B|nr:hypothetical protein [uncultured Microscilla sp.]
MQNYAKPQYIKNLKGLLPHGMQLVIASDLGISVDYVRSVLSGNRGRELSSRRAIRILEYVEDYVLDDGLSYLSPTEYLSNALSVYERRGVKRGYSVIMSKIFPVYYSPIVGFDLQIFPN